MSGRSARAISAALVLAVGLALGSAGTATAAPPNKTPTPVITSFPGNPTNSKSATFTFTNTNPSAVFSCSRDGSAYAVCTSPTTYTGLAAGSHSFSVKATAPGLKTSPTATKSWTIDLTAPNIPTVSQPSTPTKNTTTSFTFSSSSTDVSSYRCSVDGAAATVCTSPKSVTVAEGYHTFAVFAVDNATNTSPTRTVAWTVDTSTPQPVISSGPPSVTSSTSASFTFSSAEPGVSFTCSLDSTTTYSSCTSPKTYNSLTNGTRTVRVRATDAAGNVSTSDPYTWTIQPSAPVVLSWTNPGGLPASVSPSSSGTFAFTATGQTTLACRLDGVDQGTCVSPASVSGLTDGLHTFTLVANAGLGSEVQLKYTWSVDTVAPVAPTISGPSGRVATADADITVAPGSVGDSVTCKLDNVNRACTSVVSLTGLSEGAHHFVATAADAAGNNSSSSLDWTVDTEGPVASVYAPTSLSGPVVVEFDEQAGGVSSDSVFLTDLAGSVAPSSMKCYDSSDALTSCSGSSVKRVALTPTSKVVAGSYFVAVVNPSTAPDVVDDLGNVAAEVNEEVRAVTDVTESSTALSYTWRKVSDRKALGKSYVTEHRKGAQAAFDFNGKSVSWVTVAGPSFGKALVLVDGVAKATFNNYAPKNKYGVVRTVKGLSAGAHTITIRALAKKGAKSGTGTYVAIDAFKVGKAVSTTPTLRTPTWQRVSSASADGGSYAVADLKGQTVRFSFYGTGVSLVTARGKTFGKAAIYVDGSLATTIDNFSPTSSWQVLQPVSGLAEGTHTVVVKVLGTKNAGATGTGIVVDGFSVE